MISNSCNQNRQNLMASSVGMVGQFLTLGCNQYRKNVSDKQCPQYPLKPVMLPILE